MRGTVSAQWRKINSLIDSFLIEHSVAVDENPRIRFFVYSVMISIILLSGFFLFDLGSISTFRSMLTALVGVGQVVSLIALRHVANPKSAFRITALVLLVLRSLNWSPHATSTLPV
jgi:hypothetical protein